MKAVIHRTQNNERPNKMGHDTELLSQTTNNGERMERGGGGKYQSTPLSAFVPDHLAFNNLMYLTCERGKGGQCYPMKAGGPETFWTNGEILPK